MTAHDLDIQADALTAEETELRERLRAIEDTVHSRLRRDERANAHAIAAAEKEIRTIVLRLVALERERIELRVAASL